MTSSTSPPGNLPRMMLEGLDRKIRSNLSSASLRASSAWAAAVTSLTTAITHPPARVRRTSLQKREPSARRERQGTSTLSLTPRLRIQARASARV